jgi:hypothetical protein
MLICVGIGFPEDLGEQTKNWVANCPLYYTPFVVALKQNKENSLSQGVSE